MDFIKHPRSAAPVFYDVVGSVVVLDRESLVLAVESPGRLRKISLRPVVLNERVDDLLRRRARLNP